MKKYLFFTLILISLLVFTGCNKKTEEENVCTNITGGSFNLYFDTNSDEEIDSYVVYIAASPDSYELLPIPEKDGYTFDGWYYDEELTKKVDGDYTGDIQVISINNDNGCITGYQDIKIYAKWNNN